MKNNFQIIPYNKKFNQFFYDLNIEWLESYFEVEPYDLDILKYPEKLIINNGGHIFFGEINNIIIGTFAFIKNNNNSYELSKMAIEKNQRGLGYGSKMLEFAILFGQENNWKKIYLYTSSKLKNSIYLYKKYGFKKTELKSSPYKRGDIKMEYKF